MNRFGCAASFLPRRGELRPAPPGGPAPFSLPQRSSRLMRPPIALRGRSRRVYSPARSTGKNRARRVKASPTRPTAACPSRKDTEATQAHKVFARPRLWARAPPNCRNLPQPDNPFPMAKRSSPTPPGLFVVAGRRRHPTLFLPRLLQDAAGRAMFSEVEFDRAAAILKHWAGLADAGHLSHKETSLDAEFLEKIFGDALGYRSVS